MRTEGETFEGLHATSFFAERSPCPEATVRAEKRDEQKDQKAINIILLQLRDFDRPHPVIMAHPEFMVAPPPRRPKGILEGIISLILSSFAFLLRLVQKRPAENNERVST